jgi:hypothetical protein
VVLRDLMVVILVICLGPGHGRITPGARPAGSRSLQTRAHMLYLYTESVSVYAVLREGVFVAESDGVFREEGVKGDSPVFRVGSNDDFLQISTCGQNPQTASIPAFRRQGHAWSPLRNPFVPSSILSLVHGRRANAWPASRSGSNRRNFMQGDAPNRLARAAAFVVRRGCVASCCAIWVVWDG